METLNSVNCYDKSNMNVFTLSQWEIFRWGLIYIDETLRRHKRKMASKRKMSIVNKDLSCGSHPITSYMVLSWKETENHNSSF